MDESCATDGFVICVVRPRYIALFLLSHAVHTNKSCDRGATECLLLTRSNSQQGSQSPPATELSAVQQQTQQTRVCMCEFVRVCVLFLLPLSTCGFWPCFVFFNL